MKTVYVAARFALGEEVRRIYSRLEGCGYTASEDWTKYRSIKPYSANPELSREYAVTLINAARTSDLFILISDAEGTGMHTELGSAIDHNLESGKPLIYVIGEYLSRTPFFFHPSVNQRENIEQVIEELKKAA